MKFLPYGDTGLLVEIEGHHPRSESVLLGIRSSLVGAEGVVDVVPAARTVLVEFDPDRTSADALQALVETAELAAVTTAAPTSITILVRYDGPDLHEVAELTGMSSEDVIRRHSAPTYTVAFCGFAPGFAYLTGLDEALQVSRLPRPRTVVPAGAVAVAGEFTGVYPRPSPGGWRLLGTTDAPLWDAHRVPPALLSPGTTVRFEPS